MSNHLTVTYLGNHGAHNTETHVARALEHNGHTVIRVQENHPNSFTEILSVMPDTDVLLWTRTGWDWNHIFGTSHGTEMAWARQFAMLKDASRMKVPTVAYHLDRWWDLDREHQLTQEPFFGCDLVITADGGNQSRFEALGINHHWMPPGVSLGECELGMFRDEFHSKLAFVGSWQGHYHKEHEHRFALVSWLQKNFRRDCAFWPKQGHPAVRGADLRDLYASVDVVLGDSCFAGSPLGAFYWSDRVPETLGRGGYLLHPEVEGIFTQFPDLTTWEAGLWEALGALIENSLRLPAACRENALELRGHTMKHHTYERRMEQLVDLLHERNLLPS